MKQYLSIFLLLSTTSSGLCLLQNFFTLPNIQNASPSNSSDTCFLEVPTCDPEAKYRSFDGSCNNLNSPTWGVANSAFARIFEARYDDGVSVPPRAVDGGALPNARSLSVTFLKENPVDDDVALSIMQFGQFFAHDISISVPAEDGLDCCGSADSNLCLSIPVLSDDPVYSNSEVSCLNVVRTKTTLTGNCEEGPRQQINGVTHILDGSQIYGSDLETSDDLREKIGGRLVARNVSNRSFPPNTQDRNACYQSDVCYKAGDSRVNQNTQLTAIQVLFLREHNRIAGLLSELNPTWKDEELYQESRRIVVAAYQHIIYEDYLPHLLGESAIETYNLKGTYEYDSEVPPMLFNSFSTGAFRILHSGVQGMLLMLSYELDPLGALNISNWMNSPGILEADNHFDELVLGLITQRMEKIDEFYTSQMNGYMFHFGRKHGQDLSSLDIQRARDHGIPSYVTVLNACLSLEVDDFDGLNEIINPQYVEQLRQVYSSVHDIDLFIGGNLETYPEGAKLGPTFQCLIAEQFYRLRFGDRFWYEIQDQPHSFTPEQLQEIQKASLARIICDNSDAITKTTRDAFVPPSDKNPIVACEDIPEIDLSLF